MAAKSKTPLPDSYEDLVEEMGVLGSRLKQLSPLVVKAMFPHPGLKRQRTTATDWLKEFNDELADVLAKLVEAGTVYELATPPAPEPESQPAEQTPAQKSATTRARKAAEKAAAQEGQTDSPGGKTGRGRKQQEVVAA